jgi:hypothetical protein
MSCGRLQARVRSLPGLLDPPGFSGNEKPPYPRYKAITRVAQDECRLRASSLSNHKGALHPPPVPPQTHDVCMSGGSGRDTFMHRRSFIHFVISCLALVPFCISTDGTASENYRISGPIVHDNLAIYLVHGTSASGPVPLTLQEAIAKGTAVVHETGDVNRLDIENGGDAEIFVQSGDIVKGGQQDRVLTVSLLLQPHSGRIPIASFCVEKGRWAARGKEDVRLFASAASSIPSKTAKIAMKALPAPSPSPLGGQQTQVWGSVERVQKQLSANIGAPVVSSQSQTSLQLALENDKLKDAQAAYLKALQPRGEEMSDVIGYVFAVNGKLNSADIYSSNGLFRKMWPKVLAANATEAISERDAKSADTLPSTDQVVEFLRAAEQGTASEKAITGLVRLETRSSDGAYFFDTKSASGASVHRNYLAR